MNDTPPEIEAMVREKFMQKPAEERFRLGCQMYDTSRYLIEWAILNENPGISKLEFWKQIFLKFYGDDFTAEETAEIFAHMTKRFSDHSFQPSNLLFK